MPHRHRAARAAALALPALLAVAGCGGDEGGTGVAGQPALSGAFTLTDVDGAPVSSLPTSSVQLLSGFLVFPGADQALRIVTTSTTPGLGGAPVVSTDTLVYAYQQSGSQVVLHYPAPSSVADTGTVSSTASAVRIDVRTRLGLAAPHTATFLQLK